MKKIVDKNYCMSSFLALRYIADDNRVFKEGMDHVIFEATSPNKILKCLDADEIDKNIRSVLNGVDLSNAAIMLSGGIDSAILASYMPKGTKAYTARCDVAGAVDETKRAKSFCDYYGLNHVIVDVSWEDYLECIDDLMIADGCPVYANEPQVYTLVKKIKQDGADIIIYGDNADMAFGGMDRLLSKDWTYDEWIERYTFVDPAKVLKNPVDMDSVYSEYKKGENGVNVISFLDTVFAASSSGAYRNAFRLAEMKAVDPYAYLAMAEPLDLKRVRSGESKYLLRELFKRKYSIFEVPEKIAMARACDQWLARWKGPERNEFLKNCIDGMTGEQKFLVYSLERFLNLID